MRSSTLVGSDSYLNPVEVSSTTSASSATTTLLTTTASITSPANTAASAAAIPATQSPTSGTASASSTSESSSSSSSQSSPESSSSSSSQPSSSGAHGSKTWIAGAAIGGVAVLAVIAGLIWLRCRRKQKSMDIQRQLHNYQYHQPGDNSHTHQGPLVAEMQGSGYHEWAKGPSAVQQPAELYSHFNVAELPSLPVARYG